MSPLRIIAIVVAIVVLVIGSFAAGYFASGPINNLLSKSASSRANSTNSTSNSCSVASAESTRPQVITVTSTLVLDFELQLDARVAIDNALDLIETEIDMRMLSALNSPSPSDFYRFQVLSISCSVITTIINNCLFTSLIKYKRINSFHHIQTFGGFGDVNLSSSTTLSAFVATQPLANLDMLIKGPPELNVNNSQVTSRIKLSGNLEYGVACGDSSECDDNLECRQGVNDRMARCRCRSNFVAIYANYSGLFDCVESKKNYYDSCASDDECALLPNSMCFKNVCTCRPSYRFTKGICLYTNLTSPRSSLACTTHADCGLALMKCGANRMCTCVAGYHMDDYLCVPGAIRINSTCASRFDCGMNAFCDQSSGICTCKASMSSANGFDCYVTSVTVSALPLQFVYQDTSAANDIGGVAFLLQQAFDEAMYAFTSKLTTITLSSVSITLSPFAPLSNQWYIHALFRFSQPFELYEALFDKIVSLLSATGVQVVTVGLNTTTFKHKQYENFFIEVYPSRVTGSRAIAETCNIDSDCVNPKAMCVSPCQPQRQQQQPQCYDVPKVCDCRPNFYRSINLADNSFVCAYGNKFGSSCSNSDLKAQCGAHMQCATNGSSLCTCMPNYVPVGNSSCGLFNLVLSDQVPSTSIMPRKGCLVDGECPAFAKCVQGTCVCYDAYTLVSGFCEPMYNVINMTVAQTCFSASSCGLNSLCDPTLKQCVCVSNFQQANVADHCEPSCQNCSI